MRPCRLLLDGRHIDPGLAWQASSIAQGPENHRLQVITISCNWVDLGAFYSEGLVVSTTRGLAGYCSMTDI